MMVARRHEDAAAALSCGLGVLLIAIRVKPVPEVVGYLGPLGWGWGALIVVGCLGAAVGAELRNHGTTYAAYRRRVWSIRLELVCWPAIAWAALIFSVGVVAEFGWVDAAMTLGWSGFVIFTCIGAWRSIRRQRDSELLP